MPLPMIGLYDVLKKRKMLEFFLLKFDLSAFQGDDYSFTD